MIRSCAHIAIRHRQRDVCAAVCFLFALGAGASAARGVEPKLADEVESANKLYTDGQYQAALDAYTEAQSQCPECAELAYNQGLANYRLGDLVKAREKFNEALSTENTDLEARAKYNLGNVAYSDALQNQAEPDKAIQGAQNAIDFYRDALELSPTDRDARANIETANLFLEKLRQQQQQQQQQNQQQDQDQRQDQDQKQDNQQNDEQNSEENQNDQQNQGEGEQDQQEQEEQSQQGEDQQQQDQQQQQQSDQQEQSGQQNQQQQGDSANQQDSTQQQPTEARELTEEEANRLLQAVRDKEAKRREALAEQRKARRVKVDKDW